MMHGFEFYTPTRVIFGAGSLEKLPEAVGRCGAKRVFVVYGGQSAKKSGLLDRVEALLTGAGIAYAAIGGVKPNPRLGLAREAVREAIAFGADLILAVGGGSVRVIPYEIPVFGRSHRLIVVEKKAATPGMYPRPNGKIMKKPL